MKVRIGFGLGTRASSDPERFADLVTSLEALGFDSLWLSERVTGDCPDPIVGLSVAAAVYLTPWGPREPAPPPRGAPNGGCVKKK